MRDVPVELCLIAFGLAVCYATIYGARLIEWLDNRNKPQAERRPLILIRRLHRDRRKWMSMQEQYEEAGRRG